MIVKTVNSTSQGITNGTVKYPNAYSFVYNPNYVEMDLGTSITSATVSVSDGSSTYSVECSLYKGFSKCYVSKLMQLLFGEAYLSTRSVSVTLSVLVNGTTVSSSSTIAIWGSMKMGDTFGAGAMMNNWTDASNHARFTREVVWFKRFPFMISMFSPSASKTITVSRNGGSETTQGSTSVGIFEIYPNSSDSGCRELVYKIELESETILSSFTAVFDKTFTGSRYHYLDEYVKVSIKDDMQGYYLRWIDQYGFLEYWLFVSNTYTSKNKLGDTSLEQERDYNGIYYPNHNRTTHITNTDTIKCAAVNLTAGQLKTVETIVKSPHIDLFVGYDMDKNELWIPVDIVAGSYKVDEQVKLQDYEIQFTLPETATQNL